MSFSALLRAEKSEILSLKALTATASRSFSALLRAEKSEILTFRSRTASKSGFSALLRAEKSEIPPPPPPPPTTPRVSVLFCEPKNRKLITPPRANAQPAFQCSSASRKIGNSANPRLAQKTRGVSVLFCEPKNRKSKTRRQF